MPRRRSKEDGTRSGKPRHRKKTGKIGAPTVRRVASSRYLEVNLKEVREQLYLSEEAGEIPRQARIERGRKVVLKFHERRR